MADSKQNQNRNLDVDLDLDDGVGVGLPDRVNGNENTENRNKINDLEVANGKCSDLSDHDQNVLENSKLKRKRESTEVISEQQQLI